MGIYTEVSLPINYLLVFPLFNAVYKLINKALEISIPPIISVNQCTPDINLPATIATISTSDKMFIILAILLLNNFLLTKIALPQMQTDINVCDDGYDASAISFINIGL